MIRTLKTFLLASIFAAAFGAACAADGPADCTNIKTDSGPVTGVNNKGVCEYKGIPYAMPPVGEMRWRMPQPPQPWTESMVADKFGSECFQTPMIALAGGDKPIGDEDCLYLNLWARKNDSNEKKHVMMFLHGGGFTAGSGSMDTYDGARLAATGDVVVVTINYRLGAFGFFMHPSLAEPDGTLEGNYGIYDQIAALKWIRENIVNFGGDPDNVTIFGESAGGMSVGALLASPLTEGLFHRAVMQSAPVFMMNRSIEDTLPVGEELAAVVGCDDPATVADCLRAMPSEDVMRKLQGGLMFLADPNKKMKFPSEPLYGGKLIPDTPYRMYRDGKYHKDVPVIIGSNRDEFSFFALKEHMETREEFEAKISDDRNKISRILGADVLTEDLTSFYNPDNYESPVYAYSDMMGDIAFTCPTRVMANFMAGNDTPVYLYHFKYVSEGIDMIGDWGAFHGSELPIVFGNMTFMGIKFPYQNNKIVSRKVRGLWYGFAHNGIPASEDVPEWPRYDAEKQDYLEIDFELKADSAFKKDRCAVYEKLMATYFNKP